MDIYRVEWSDGTSTYFIGMGTKEEVWASIQGLDKTPVSIVEDDLELKEKVAI